MTGRYRLVESIGQGGMGRVWRAVDEMLDRLVAVKEMRIDGLDPEDTRTRRERTLREARATARIDHPNVVRVYDVVDEGERLWIVMELVAGRSLERIMAEEGPLGPCETARIGIGLLAALRQVHARGVLHRDIKPGNVLVETQVPRARGRGRVVLTDFGIAAIQDAKALTMVGMLVGSPDYMAPERISGRPQGPPSDIWSLGATLSAALTGRSPFSRDTTLATLHAVLYEEPELPPTAGPLRDILAALLEKDPTHRPGLDDLETSLEPVAFPAPTPTMPVVGGVPRERAPEPGGGGDGGDGRPAVMRPGGETGLPGRGGDGGASSSGSGGAGDAPGPGRGGTKVEVESGSGGGGAGPGSRGGVETEAGPVARGTSAEVEASRQGAESGAREPGTERARRTAGRQEPGSGGQLEPGPPIPERGPTPATGPPPEPERTNASVREPEQTQGHAAEPGQAHAPNTGIQPAAASAPELQPHHGSGPASIAAPGLGLDALPAHAPGPPALSPDSASPDSASQDSASQDSASPDSPTPDSATTELPSTPARPPTGPATPHLPWSPGPSRESATPAYLETPRVPPPPDPRQPEDIRDAIPPQHSAPTPTPTLTPTVTSAPTVTPAPPPSPATDPHHRAPNASTELASPSHSEVRSPTPARTSDGVPPHRSAVSLTRAEAPTERRPAPGPGHPTGGHSHSPMPPGEFPGPVTPAEPRRARRRTGKAAAVGIVAAGAVVAVILATDPGAPKDDQAGSSPSTSAPTTARPSSTVEGTSRPQSLPPGSRREAGGFAWVPPEEWRRDVQTGSEVHYTSPDAAQELAAKSSLARDDLMDSWQKSEENAQQGQQYRKIRLERTTFRGHPAVVWEYTFTLQGDPWHAQLLGFTVDGKSYQINTWYRPDIETEALKTYEKVKDTFTVL